MESNQVQLTKKYIDIVIRRKALILFCILVGVCVGLIMYLRSPKIYQAAVLLSYQQQAISPSKMSPDNNVRIRDVISTLSPIVTSRSNLEKIINQNSLFAEELEKNPLENVIETMRSNISVFPARRGNTFTVSVNGDNPDEVVRVSNAVAAGFIEENLKYREERASDISAYTEDELEMAKVMLDKKDAIMRDYKLKYYYEMPDQREPNVSRLISLQDQYQKRQKSIQDLEQTKMLIRDQIANRERLFNEGTNVNIAASGQSELIRLNLMLENLQSKYTDKHPEIIRLRKAITRLESINSDNSDGSTNQVMDNSRGGQNDVIKADLQSQLKDINNTIEELGIEKERMRALVEQYEKWVSNTPIREAEWTALTREYGELKRHYDYLISRNLQARSSLNLERKQKGSQFKIEDPAQKPRRPASPDLYKIMLMAFLSGAGAGLVIALGLDLLNTSFRDPDAIANTFDIEVICAVPYVPLRNELLKERIMTVLGSFLFLVCFSGIGYAFVYFWKQGQIVL